MEERQVQIGLLLYPGLTQLDLTGPFEVLSRVPSVTVHVVARTASAGELGPARC